MLKKINHFLKPKNFKYIAPLLKWELFAPSGLLRPQTAERTIREKIQKRFSKRFPNKGSGYYARYDWFRLELALHFLTGNSLLEVGPYNGAFLHMTKELYQHRGLKNFKIDALDLTEHPCLLLPEGSNLILNDVTAMDFASDSYDTVSAMEIIEHLPPEAVAKALEKIRIVAKERVIFSVPLNEPYPLFKADDPSGHKQSFDEEKIYRLFPGAFFTIAEAGLGVPWVIAIEDKKIKSTHSSFKVSDFDELKTLLLSQ